MGYSLKLIPVFTGSEGSLFAFVYYVVISSIVNGLFASVECH